MSSECYEKIGRTTGSTEASIHRQCKAKNDSKETGERKEGQGCMEGRILREAQHRHRLRVCLQTGLRVLKFTQEFAQKFFFGFRQRRGLCFLKDNF